MSVSSHLRGLVIAGALAAVALGLAFFTLAMNHSGAPAVPQAAAALPATAIPAAVKAVVKVVPKAKPKVKPKPNRNFVAALKAGLPRSVALGLVSHRVVVVSLTSAEDSVAVMAGVEAHAGARLAGASFVRISVDRNGGDVSTLTRSSACSRSCPRR